MKGKINEQWKILTNEHHLKERDYQEIEKPTKHHQMQKTQEFDKGEKQEKTPIL